MSLVDGCGKLKTLSRVSCLIDDFIAITLGWLLYVSIIFSTVSLSCKGFEESPSEDGF